MLAGPSSARQILGAQVIQIIVPQVGFESCLLGACPEMMKMTETAFDEAENMIASAETRLGEAWDHTQKILERNDVEETDEIDTGKNSLFFYKYLFLEN